MEGALIQLIAKGAEDELLTSNPTITYFKYAFMRTPLFYKNDLSLENIQINWDNNYTLNIDKNIHLLGEVFIKVSLPYFQLSKTTTTTTTNTISNDILTKMIYDNYPTYLFLVKNDNDTLNYYLIPEFILFNYLSTYSILKIPFSKIKQYFHDLLDDKINDNEEIYFLSFTDVVFVNEVIPILLKFGNIIDQYYINILLNTTEQLNKNLILPNSYDNYLSLLVKDKLFNNYQLNNSLDEFSKYHALSSNEFKFYYDNFKNNITTYTLDDTSVNLDSIRSYEYYQKTDLFSEKFSFIKDTIIKNPLLLQYFLLNLHSPVDKIFTFYKKFDIVLLEGSYEFYLLNENIIDVDSSGEANLISHYYPNYSVDLTTFDHENVFTDTMVITTIDGLSVKHETGSNNNIRLVTINDIAGATYSSDNIILIINDSNRTDNDINPVINNTDYNLNNEWIDNIKINLDNLEGNATIESLLLSSFKSLYFLQENIIKNIFDDFPDIKNNKDKIINLWVELKTYYDIFEKFDTDIYEGLYRDVHAFYTDKQTILTNYSKIGLIEKLPQDLFNTYVLCIMDFFRNIRNKYLVEDYFIQLFHNKIINYFYMRFYRISKLEKTNISGFKGLLFYMNLDMNEYISTDIIRNFLLDLFTKTSFIGYAEFDETKINALSPLRLQENSLGLYTVDSSNKARSTLSDINYIHELQIDAEYNIIKTDYIIEGKTVKINKNLFYYYNYHGTLTTFVIQDDTDFYDVSKYSIDSNYLILNMNEELNITNGFVLKETTILSIPLLFPRVRNNGTEMQNYLLHYGKLNDFKRLTIFDKTNNIDKFINYKNIQINKTIDSNTYVFMIYKNSSTSDIINVKLEQDTSNNYNISSLSDNKEIPENYTSYDTVTIHIFTFPITSVVINDSDCKDLIKNTYPYIKLKTDSSIYTTNSSLFTTLNTFKTSDNIPIRIDYVDTDHIRLLVIDNNTFSDSSLSMTIFDNSYLPNMMKFSGTDVKEDIASITNYIMQKPMLLQLHHPYLKQGDQMETVDEGTVGEQFAYEQITELPIFVFVNIPNPAANKRYSKHTMLLDNKNINNLINLDGNQVIRNNLPESNSFYNENIFSLYYDKVNIRDVGNIDKMQDIILAEFDNSFSTDTFNGKIIKIIEDSYKAYTSSYLTILDDIKNTDVYGDTIKNVYNILEELNTFKTITGNTTFKIDPMNFELVEYDMYTILAPSYYIDYTTINNQLLTYDNMVFDALAKKYIKTSGARKALIPSPWLHMFSKYRLSNNLHAFLEHLSLFIKNQFNYINDNLVINNIFNAANFGQRVDTKLNLDSNYTKLTHNVNNIQVKLENENKYSEYIDNSEDSDIYTHVYYKNNKLDIDSFSSTDNSILMSSNSHLFSRYKNNSIYVENVYNNNNHKLSDKYYNLIGPIEIKDNKVILDNTFTPTDYLVISNKVVKHTSGVIDDTTLDGINYNCKSCNINTTGETFTFTKMGKKIFYINIETSGLDIYLNENSNYFVQIGNTIGCMKFVSNYLILFTNNEVIFTKKLKIFYSETSNSNTDMLNALLSQSEIVYNNSLILDNYSIINISSFNYYCKTTWSYSDFIIKKDSTVIDQYYSDYIKFFDDYVFLNINSISHTTTTIDIDIFSCDTSLLPPLVIEDSTVQIFNILNDINWVTYKDHWVCINNNEFQIKDILNQNISDGNYLLFYCHSDVKPYKLPYLDLYYNTIKLESVSSIIFDPYKNIYIIEKDFTELTTLDPYFDSDKNATSSIIIETDENISIIKSWSTYNASAINFNLDKDIFINTDLIINKNNNLYNRPFIIARGAIFYTYNYYNKAETDMSDSLFTIATSDTTSDSIFLTKLIFDSGLGTIYLHTNNSNITLTKNDTDGQNWSINIKNTDDYTVTSDLSITYAHKIILDVSDNEDLDLATVKEEIFLWIIISDVYPDVNIISTDITGSEYVTEPFFISMSNKKQLSLKNNTSGDFYFVDNKYFNLEISESETLLVSYIFGDQVLTSYNIYANQINSFDEITGDVVIKKLENKTFVIKDFDIKSNTNKYIKSQLKTWDYLDNVTVYLDKIQKNTDLLKDYKYYIFISDDKLIYNELKSIDQTSSTIKLLYNINTITADVFIYNYEPFFINTSMKCVIDIDTIYIYDIFGKLERNEIIKINENVIRVLYYSNYYNAYIGKIISPVTNISNIVDGYYSFGKFNNYLDRYYMLKNNNVNNLFYYNKKSELIYGDYYIDDESNELKIYDDNLSGVSDYIFKLNKGSYFYILYYKKDSVTRFYYDPSIVNLENGMVLYYTYGSTTYRLIINNIVNNELFFISSTIDSSIISGTPLRVYLPIQPFKYKDISVLDNIINITDFNGWIENVDGNNINLYKIVDSYTTNSFNGSYRVLDISEFNLYSDFTNNYTIDGDSTTNKKLPIVLSLIINVDDSNRIYFTSEESINFSELQYCYYQEVLINDSTLNIIYVTSSRIYINKTKDTFPLKYNTSKKYTVILSAGNVNNTFFLSNRNKLTDNYYYTYPNIELGKYELNVVFYTYFTDNSTNLSNNFNYVIKDSELNKLENGNLQIESYDLTQIRNNVNVWHTDVNRLLFLENYVPLTLTDDDYLYFEIRDASLLQKMSSTKYHIIIEECYNDQRYLHFASIVIVNYNIVKLSSTNSFKSIDESIFYMNRTIPIRITKDNYIQILEPEIIHNREINNKITELLDYYVYNKIKINGIPTKNQDKWKYQLNITSDKYNILKNKKLYYNKNIMNDNYVTQEIVNGETYYYLYSDRYIEKEYTYLFFKVTNYINEIKFKTTTIRDEYDNINDSELLSLLTGNDYNNNYKIQNKLCLQKENSQYKLSFRTTDDTDTYVINFGELLGDYYLDKINKVKELNEISRWTGYENKYDNITDGETRFFSGYTIIPTNELYNIYTYIKEYEMYEKISTNSVTFIPRIEKAPSSRTMIELLKDKGIDLSLILNNKKPWENWSQVTMHHNSDLSTTMNIVKEGIVYIDGQIKYKSSVTFDTTTGPTEDIESRFISKEVDMIKALLDSWYVISPSDSHIEFYKFNELREIEEYIYKQLFYLVKQEYFWYNIDSVMLNLVENYNIVKNKHFKNTWTFYKGCIMTYNSGVLEINELLEDGTKKEDYSFELVGESYRRKFYLTSDFTITCYKTDITDKLLGYYLGCDFYLIERAHTILNTETDNLLNKKTSTFYGNRIDDIVVFLKELFKYKKELEPNKNDYYTYYLYGSSNSGNTKGQKGFYYPLSLTSYDDDHEHTFTEFPNDVFYMPNNMNNHGKSLPPPDISGLINYNSITNVGYYIYYLYGTSNSNINIDGKEVAIGKTGYYYPLSLTSFNNDHPHVFVEFPNITFYMPNNEEKYVKSEPPSIISTLINYNELSGISVKSQIEYTIS